MCADEFEEFVLSGGQHSNTPKATYTITPASSTWPFFFFFAKKKNGKKITCNYKTTLKAKTILSKTDKVKVYKLAQTQT